MVGRSFQDILNEKLSDGLNIEKRSSSAFDTIMDVDIDPAGLAFLLGQIGRFERTARPTNPYPRPKPTPKKPRPAHTFNDKQRSSFEYFGSSFSPLSDNFSLDELKRSFRCLALKLHPDQGGDALLFMELKTHFEILCQLFKQKK